MKKPSISKLRATGMATLAALIACHPAMGLFNLVAISMSNQEKIGQLADGTYSVGRAISASLQTFAEGMATGSIAFLFTLPIALLFGLPAHIVLLKSGFWKKRHYAIAGAFLGTVAYVHYIASTEDTFGLSFPSSLHLLLGTSTGLIAAVLFRIFMGNKGNPNNLPATWHDKLFDKPNLPKNMPVGPVAILCALSGLLPHIVSIGIAAVALIASNLPAIILSASNEAAVGVPLFDGLSKYMLRSSFFITYALQLFLGSLLFTGTYFALRRIKRTGWIAFALSGLMIPLINASLGSLGRLTGPFVPTRLIVEGLVLSTFAYILTAIIFRACLGRIATRAKGRNVFAPAS